MAQADGCFIFAQDFLADVSQWSNEELGVYWRLLLVQMIDRRLSTDLEELAIVAHVKPGLFVGFWEKRLSAKFDLDDQGHFNPKLDRALQKAENYRKSQSDKGKRGGRPRSKKAGALTGALTGEKAGAKACVKALPNPNPIVEVTSNVSATSNVEPLKTEAAPQPSPCPALSSEISVPSMNGDGVASAGYTGEFERFWARFPRKGKQKKKRAFKAWQSALQDVSAAEILAGLEAVADSPKAQSDFCPHAATWLNGGAWADDPSGWWDREGDSPAAQREQRTMGAFQEYMHDRSQK